jgi:hypothetical protein
MYSLFYTTNKNFKSKIGFNVIFLHYHDCTLKIISNLEVLKNYQRILY